MPVTCLLDSMVPAEHRALCREYAAVQERCSRVMAQQRAEIAQLQAQVVRLRGAAIVQLSALAFACEDWGLLEASRRAADRVICQTGCLSHGAYWRDHGHCLRTDQACALPGAPATTHLVAKTGSSACQTSAGSYQNQ